MGPRRDESEEGTNTSEEELAEGFENSERSGSIKNGSIGVPKVADTTSRNHNQEASSL